MLYLCHHYLQHLALLQVLVHLLHLLHHQPNYLLLQFRQDILDQEHQIRQ